jgi:HEPN domain-containing protein
MSGRRADWSAWTDKADHDFQTIALVKVAAEPPWDSVAFHAQQAAEKYLKAYAEPTRSDAERGVRIAERVRDVVRTHLPTVGETEQ